MAFVKDSFMEGVSGAIGKQIVFKRYHGKTVVSKMPDMSKRVLSEKQLEQNERMRVATIYAKYIYKTEEGKIIARIRLKLPAHKSLFHALVKEFLDQNKLLSMDEMYKNLDQSLKPK